MQQAFSNRHSGQSLIEYGILLALVVVVSVASFSNLGSILKDQLTLAYSFGDERDQSVFSSGGGSTFNNNGGSTAGGTNAQNGEVINAPLPSIVTDNSAPQVLSGNTNQTSSAGIAEGEGSDSVGGQGNTTLAKQGETTNGGNLAGINLNSLSNLFGNLGSPNATTGGIASGDNMIAQGGSGLTEEGPATQTTQLGTGSDFQFSVDLPSSSSSVNMTGASGETSGVDSNTSKLNSAISALREQRAAGKIDEASFNQGMKMVNQASQLQELINQSNGDPTAMIEFNGQKATVKDAQAELNAFFSSIPRI